MKMPRNVRLCAILQWTMLAAVLALPPSLAAKTVDQWDGNWHYTLSPYAWLPGISASMRFQVPNATVFNRSTGNIWDNLAGALELKGTARKGRWGVYGDFDWVDFSGMRGRAVAVGPQGVPVAFGSSWDARGAMVHMAGLYDLAHGRAGFIDLLFGVRYVRINGALAWNLSAGSAGGTFDFARSGRRSRSADFVDPVIGVRGRWLPFHGRFFVPWHADFGGNGSTSSAQASVGIGYAFHWGDAALSWRQIRLRQDNDAALLRRVTLSGPSVQATWHF